MLAICDRCGFEYKSSQLRKEWTGFMVCHGAGTNGCWEPRHPQEFVRGVRDDQGIRPNMRPEPEDVFITPDGYDSLSVQDDDGSYGQLAYTDGEGVYRFFYVRAA